MLMSKYMCQLCANHGQFYQPKKGHKQKCPYRTCLCNLCELNTKRRALDQIERRLRYESEKTVESFESQDSASLDKNLRQHSLAEAGLCNNENWLCSKTFRPDNFDTAQIARNDERKPDKREIKFYSELNCDVEKVKQSAATAFNNSTTILEMTRYGNGNASFHSIDRLLSTD